MFEKLRCKNKMAAIIAEYGTDAGMWKFRAQYPAGL